MLEVTNRNDAATGNRQCHPNLAILTLAPRKGDRQVLIVFMEQIASGPTGQGVQTIAEFLARVPGFVAVRNAIYPLDLYKPQRFFTFARLGNFPGLSKWCFFIQVAPKCA
jgi:hypothetical protein